MTNEIFAHLKIDSATTCYVWRIECRDGRSFRFTDHDEELELNGELYQPTDGFSPAGIERSIGLSIDNSQALGAISLSGIDSVEFERGVFDYASFQLWLVNWRNVNENSLRFAGFLGKVNYSEGNFTCELQSQSSLLNQTKGRIYQNNCDASFGDLRCGIDLSDPRYFGTGVCIGSSDNGVILLLGLSEYSAGWFEGGKVKYIGSASQEVWGNVRFDKGNGSIREIYLSETHVVQAQVGLEVQVFVGCDRRLQTCESKFANARNFRGFPFIPGDDWVFHNRT